MGNHRPYHDLLCAGLQPSRGHRVKPWRLYVSLTSLSKGSQACAGKSGCAGGDREDPYSLLKRNSEALTELQDALKIYPDSPELYFHLAKVCVRLGEREEAARAPAIFRRLRAGEASAPR